ncbi:MAG: CRTAC1 family protein [Myxococcota bacterium]
MLRGLWVCCFVACTSSGNTSRDGFAEGLSFEVVVDPVLATVRTGPAGGWESADMFSGGVVFRDLDGDDRPDLLVARSSAIASEQGVTLLRQHEDGSFEDVSELAGVTYRGPATAAVAGDLNGDGRPDLYVATEADGDRLYLQRENFRFEEVGERAGIRATGRRSRSIALLDYDNDGWLDIYVLDWNGQGPLGMDGGASAHDAPNVLYRNLGDERFEDVTDEAGVACAGRSSLGVGAADLDADGDSELYIANEFFDDCLYENLGDGTFRLINDHANVGTHANGGMGVAFGDADGDGDLDIVVTDDLYEDGARGNPVYRNDGGLRFENVAAAWGLEGAESVAQGAAIYWGVAFRDFDLDGRMDLHMAQHATGPDYVFRWSDDRFEAISRDRFSLDGDVRGSAYADLDRDGRVDLVAVGRGGPVELRRNRGGAGQAFLRIRLEGPGANLEAIGALVYVEACGSTTVHSVQAGTGYLSASEPIVTAGLGRCTRANVRVLFPGGEERVLRARANEDLTIGF